VPSRWMKEGGSTKQEHIESESWSRTPAHGWVYGTRMKRLYLCGVGGMAVDGSCNLRHGTMKGNRRCRKQSRGQIEYDSHRNGQISS